MGWVESGKIKIKQQKNWINLGWRTFTIPWTMSIWEAFRNFWHIFIFCSLLFNPNNTLLPTYIVVLTRSLSFFIPSKIQFIPQMEVDFNSWCSKLTKITDLTAFTTTYGHEHLCIYQVYLQQLSSIFWHPLIDTISAVCPIHFLAVISIEVHHWFCHSTYSSPHPSMD